jgi:hypothetical protein
MLMLVDDSAAQRTGYTGGRQENRREKSKKRRQL